MVAEMVLHARNQLEKSQIDNFNLMRVWVFHQHVIFLI